MSTRFGFLAMVWTVCLWLAGPELARAVPANPEGATIRQPDGTEFRLNLRGDEHFSWHETSDGYAVVKDPADGFWKYARPESDRAAFVIISGAKAGTSDPLQLKLKKHAMPDKTLLNKAREKRRMPKPASTQSPAPGTPAATSTPSAELPEPLPAKIPISGSMTIKNVVILAAFKDHWDTPGNTVLSSKGRVTVSEYTNLFNQVNHTNDGAVGSVADYYREVSYNRLTVSTVVSAWVKLPQNESYYGTNTGLAGTDIWPDEMAMDAINAADAAGFDFSQGDSDSDGWVDCLTVIHSGHGEEILGNPTTLIWSHQGWTTSTLTKDGRRMKKYHTEPALRGNTASTSIIRIGTTCHEMGHFFGLPDLYDYSNTTYGAGDWCLMAYGSWNGSTGDGRQPAHFSAWCKYMLGFVVPQEVHSAATLSMPRVEDTAAVHLVRDGTSNREYFLVENRANWGFDNDTASIYPGLLIWHIDSKSLNNDLGTWSHPAVKLEEADGDNSLGTKTAFSESGDVWTNTNGIAGGFRDQTGDQDCNSMLYQPAHAYNRSDNSTYYSYVRLNSFSAPSSLMTYTLSTLRPTVTTQLSGTPNYTVIWGACSNSTKYEIQEGTTTTLTSFSDGAEDENATQENWSLGGTVRRDTGGANSGSYSYGMLYYDGTNFYAPVQFLTMRAPFKVTASTAVSFYFLSHVDASAGYLKLQISKDSGNTWATLGTFNGWVNSWSYVNYNYPSLNLAGIVLGDMCIIRFVCNIEDGYGWSGYPDYGFAVDDISITNAEISSYGNWVSLNNNVLTNSYPITGKPNGVYAYQVRSYSNAVWQNFGLAGQTVVVPVTLSGFSIE